MPTSPSQALPVPALRAECAALASALSAWRDTCYRRHGYQDVLAAYQTTTHHEAVNSAAVALVMTQRAR